jgi:hypothetical protein
LSDDGSGFETSVIANVPAFQHLLFDYNVWKKSDPDLLCCVFINMRQLVTKSSKKMDNIAILRSLDAIEKLFLVVMDVRTPPRVADVCIAMIG